MIIAEKIFDETFTARNFNSSPLTVSGLLGDTYDYELIFWCDNATGANSAFFAALNADETANYREFYILGQAGSVFGSVNNADNFARWSNPKSGSKPCLSRVKFTGSSGDERLIDALSSYESTVNTRIQKFSFYWKNTVDELTSLVFKNQASTTTDELRIILYRTPKVASQAKWELMKTLSWSAETAEKAFSSLLGDTDLQYRLDWSGDQELNIEINNDGAANYTRQYLQNSGGSISAANTTTDTSIVTDGIESSVIINAETGTERLCVVSSSNTAAVQQSERSVWYSNTVTEITSLDCTPTASATGIAKLYRRINPAASGDTLNFETIHNKALSSTDYSAGDTLTILGDSMKLLKIEGLLSNASGDIEIRMQLNSDTAGNYPEQLLKGDTSAASAAVATRNYIVLAKLQQGDQAEFTHYLFTESGSDRPGLTECSYDENAVEKLAQWWSNSADEITAVKIFASSTNAVTGNIKVSRLI